MRSRFSLSSLFSPFHYFTHFLILIALGVSILGFAEPMIKILFGLHQIPLTGDGIIFLIGQILFYQFLHGDILHLFMNVYFLYQAGPEVENRMSSSRFKLFFVLNTLFVAAALWFLSSGFTIGISGFCMALLSYLWIDLTTTRHPLANQILIMLVINIALGFFGNISFVGHFFGAVFGVMWWYLGKR